MGTRPEREEETEQVAPGTALDSTEGADVGQTVTEAVENDKDLRDDLQDEDLITLDTPD